GGGTSRLEVLDRRGAVEADALPAVRLHDIADALLLVGRVRRCGHQVLPVDDCLFVPTDRLLLATEGANQTSDPAAGAALGGCGPAPGPVLAVEQRDGAAGAARVTELLQCRGGRARFAEHTEHPVRGVGERT